MPVLKFKKLHDTAVIPKRANPGDAGLDLTAAYVYLDQATKVYHCGTHLAVEIPDGYVGLIFPRSSVYKKDIILSNCVGVIDSGYRGEIAFKYKPINTEANLVDGYNTGDRVGQLVIMPCLQWDAKEVDELTDTKRGEGGFGSSGS